MRCSSPRRGLYHWLPQDREQDGYFCISTAEFLLPAKSGVLLDEVPLFQPGGYPVFPVTDEEYAEVKSFLKLVRRYVPTRIPER